MSGILIVDDDRLARCLMAKFLDEAGYSVFSAACADEGYEILQGNQIALMVTDMRMPGDSGLELYRRAVAQWPFMRCILCSAYIDYSVLTQIVSSGIDDSLIKPVNQADLLESVQRSFVIQQHWRSRVNEMQTLNRQVIP